MPQASQLLVQRASLDDLDSLTPLFDAYRVFYGRQSDLALAHAFLRERLERSESVVFLAFDSAEVPVGFTQLYPSFSSVSASRIFVLNDLYVTPQARRRGVAGALLSASETHARQAGAIRLSLSTALDNDAAKALYTSRGWKRDTQFCSYNLPLS